MNKYTIIVDTIKSSVSALDVADALGWEVKHGRCKCPIHNGDGLNCRLYPGDRGYMCWVCKSAGDVISLVRNYYHDMSFKQAVTWFNSTFNLGLDLDRKMDPAEARRAEMALQRRKREQEFREWKSRMKFDLALTADQIVRLLEDQRDRNVPKTANETWNPKFCEAVRMLPAVRRYAEELMFNCIEVRKDG